MIYNKKIAIIGWIDRTNNFADILSRENYVYRIGTMYEQEKVRKSQIINKNNQKIYLEKNIKYAVTFQKLKRCFLIRNKIDLFHGHDINNIFYRLIDSKPFVLTLHGYPSLERMLRNNSSEKALSIKLVKKQEKFAFKKASAIICVDCDIKNYYLGLYPEYKKKVFCIPNGIDIQKFHNCKDRHMFKNSYCNANDIFIVCIRKFNPGYGVFIVLEAINKLKNEFKKENFKLILGGGGEYEDFFKKYIKENSLENVVSIFGQIPHEDVLQFFYSADIIINTFSHHSIVEKPLSFSLLSSLKNNLPIATSNTTLEALASGNCTIVCTPSAKFEDISAQNVGIQIPDNDSSLLAEILSQLTEDSDLRKRIGKNGQDFVSKNRSWEIIANEIKKVYEYALDK